MNNLIVQEATQYTARSKMLEANLATA